MNKILIILFLFTFNNSFSQEKLTYKSILNTSIDESFPNAAAILVVSFKIGIEKFEYGNKLLKSTWYEYYRGVSRYRCKYLITIDKNSTLDIKVVDIQLWLSSQGYWMDSGEGLFSKKEEKIRTSFIELLRQTNLNKKTTKQNQEWFFRDITINSLFFDNATDLAGERWFEKYLKDKKLEWNLNFVDIERNTTNNYKYKEMYFYSISPFLAYNKSKFYILKYTNNDSNVLVEKGNKLKIEGYCKKLVYNKGVFYITLTEELDSELPIEKTKDAEISKQKSILDIADDLKKLKELLDIGVITETEYQEEKNKLLLGE